MVVLFIAIGEVGTVANAYRLHTKGTVEMAEIINAIHEPPLDVASMAFPRFPHLIRISGLPYQLTLNREYSPGAANVQWLGKDKSRAVICDDKGKCSWIEAFGGLKDFLVWLGGLFYLCVVAHLWVDRRINKKTQTE